MIYITSDIHGKTKSLMKLLEKASFFSDDDNMLYILGDVIDRNEGGGVDLLKWLTLQHSCQLILGNHEAMMLACSWLFEEITEDSIAGVKEGDLDLVMTWRANGGDATIDALYKETPDTREAILEYLRDCPLYEEVSAGGKNYLLVHAGLGNYRQDKPIESYTADELLHGRPTPETVYSSEFITVFGHTPTGYYDRNYRGRMIKTPTWWDIDTGAAGGLEPMLLCLDTGEAFYLEEEESK